MAKTFNDFVIECTSYPYSQEHLDLMKECSELELTCQYLSNQEFIREHASMFGENTGIEPGYLTESVDDGTVEELYESVKKKKSNIKLKIFNGLRHIIGIFVGFIHKIANAFDDTTKAAATARDMLAKATINDEVIAKLQDIVEAGKKKADGFVPHERQPFTKQLKMKYQGTSTEYSMLRADLCAALSDDVVIAKVSEGDKFGAIAAKDIEDSLIQLTLGGTGAVNGALSSLAASFDKAKVNGIQIKANTKDIEAQAKRLDKIKEKIDEVIQGLVDQVNATENTVTNAAAVAAGAMQMAGAAGTSSDPDNPGNEPAQKISKIGKNIGEYMDLADAGTTKVINQAYTAVNATIGATTKVYIGLNTYRRQVSSDLIKYLGSLPKGSGKGAPASEAKKNPKGEETPKSDGEPASGEKTKSEQASDDNS